MFDLGATELLVIGIVAIIVVGPKELPKMLRGFGQFVAKMRGMAREFQGMFEEAARDTGVDGIAKSVGGVKDFSVTDQVSKAFDPIADEAGSLDFDLEADEPATGSKKKPKEEDPIEAGNKASSTKSSAAKAAPKRVRSKTKRATKPRKKKTAGSGSAG